MSLRQSKLNLNDNFLYNVSVEMKVNLEGTEEEKHAFIISQRLSTKV